MYFRQTIKTLTSLAFLLQMFCLFAQKNFTLSGYVKEAKSGEVLEGAGVYFKDSEFGTYSGDFGFYSLSAPAGNYTLIVEYVGYKTQEIQLSFSEDKSLNFNLETDDVRSNEVVITDERKDANVKSTDMGKTELKIDAVKKLPVLFGEVDILKTIQLLPGVQAAEGTTGLYVRGGGPDQNLMLLDGAPIYNAGHLLGFFSVFNGDAVRSFDFYKGYMPPEYGSRLSSVIDVTMKDGNNQKFQGKGGIGLISSRLTLEGPIIKNKASFLVSARRTYADALAQPFIKKTSPFKGSGYYFYDFNVKMNYAISDKDRIFFTGYYGQDIFNFKSGLTDFTFNIPWGNRTATLRWNHLFNPKLFCNTSVLFNDYRFKFGVNFQQINFSLSSRVKDWTGKSDFTYMPNTKHKIKFGWSFTYHTFEPNGLTFQIDTIKIDNSKAFQKFANEMGVYFQDEWDISSRFKLNGGIRLSAFQQLGNQIMYDDKKEVVLDTLTYGWFNNTKFFGAVEPRLAARYSLTDKASIKASYTRTAQFVHMVSIAGTFPSDFWVPTSAYPVKPQLGNQYSLGFYQNIRSNSIELSAEVFYRQMKNQIEYNENYTQDVRENYETNFVFGRGTAYGLELFARKEMGKLTGWISYTLARSYRIFDDTLNGNATLNNGEKFAYTYDRRHSASVVVTYDMDKIEIGGKMIYKNPVTLSGVFVYSTGNAINLIDSRAILLFSGGTSDPSAGFFNTYLPRNSFRMPAYNRADISMTLHGAKLNKAGKPKRIQSDWIISVYNVYNRLNPYFVYFSSEGNAVSSSFTTKAYKVSVFPIIPSVTWDFSF